jgi:hypothetical protein
MTREIGYKTKPIDQAFLSKPEEFPITGEHNGHNVRAAGTYRIDGDGKPAPTAHGIHGTNTAVDWDACLRQGQGARCQLARVPFMEVVQVRLGEGEGLHLLYGV